LTLHKLYHAADRHLAKRRCASRDEPISKFSSTELEIPGREPTPDEVAAAADELAAVLDDLSERDRRILELCLQGYDQEETAERLQCSARTVRRAIHAARRMMVSRGGRSFVPTAARRRPANFAPAASRPPLDALNQDTAPLKWTDFTLEKQIGAGAMGRVYRALERGTNRPVAVKFLRKSWVGDAAAMKRFVREAQTVASWDHPAIVATRGWGATPGGGLFLVMDLVDGLDLEKLRRRQAADVSDCIRWILEAAAAIEFAHRFDVIHCDVKPSNLLLGRDGRIRLTDFGLAVRRLDGNRSASCLAGTPAFMAPEQVDPCWGEISPATDVWGLGSVLYFLLFSQPPHTGDDVPATLANVVSKAPVRFPATTGLDVPALVLEVLRDCLAKSPTERIATPGQLIHELSKALEPES
jgi:serine/threonine protein kinase